MLAGDGFVSVRSKYCVRTEGLAAANSSQARSLASEGEPLTDGVVPGA
jgi:hypothetical protein